MPCCSPVNVQRIYWYLLHDDQDIMKLTTPDATPRQSAYAMQIINTEPRRRDVCHPRESTLPGLYSMFFARPDGTQVRVMWSLQPTTVTVSGQTRVTDMVGNDVGVSSLLSLSDAPVYVEGPLGKAFPQLRPRKRFSLIPRATSPAPKDRADGGMVILWEAAPCWNS